MLTREHALFEYRGGRIHPDRLTRITHAHYPALAARMLEIYHNGVGKTRQELHREVHRLFENEEECPARRIEAFCKLLDDASTYETDRRGGAARLRSRVFQLAAPAHPLVREPDRLFESQEMEVKLRIAREIGRPWPEIEQLLFSDVMEFHRLVSFEGYASSEVLLSRYNVAQVQAALYRAVELQVRARRDFKDLLRYARLAGLMYTVNVLGPEHYEMRFDGPASVLRHTTRYGVSMARFLPAVLACREWSLRARVQTPRRGHAVELVMSDADGLRSHVPSPEEFDSSLEEHFARKWGTEPRDGWSLVREGAILIAGQKAFTPDFVLHHTSGRTIMLEIVGFWTPEYLKQKAETLKLFPRVPILLAVAERVGGDLPPMDVPVVTFKSVLKLKSVLEALERHWG